MANERNAGRKPKYANKCKQVGFNLPLDVIDEVKEKVREIVRTKAKRFGEPTIAEIKEVLMNTHVIDLNTGNTKRIKDLFEKAEFPCGCSIENNLLKRGKVKCRLTKEQHLKS